MKDTYLINNGVLDKDCLYCYVIHKNCLPTNYDDRYASHVPLRSRIEYGLELGLSDVCTVIEILKGTRREYKKRVFERTEYFSSLYTPIKF